jgi:PTS system ascorbate-specific IIB component
MTVEDVLKEMGVEASVTATDSSSVRSAGADIVLGQAMHTAELEGVAPAVVAVRNFVDKAEVRAALERALDILQGTGGK